MHAFSALFSSREGASLGVGAIQKLKFLDCFFNLLCDVYLTNLNSASGATKPIGFNGMTPPPSDYETLRAETARAA